MIVKDPNDMIWHIVNGDQLGEGNDLFHYRKRQSIPCVLSIED